MRIMLVIAYDGSLFKGFQRQKNVRNVQGELEKTLSMIYDENIIIKGAGRTDRGVHAKYQVVHYDTNKKIPYLKDRLNKELKDIEVKKVKKVSNDFHARFNVKEKVYLYKIDLSGKRDSNYYLNYPRKLNIKKMKEAAKVFIGTHEFHNFTAGYRDNYVTTITKIKIWQFHEVLYLKFYGYAFFRYMVRNLVGALLEIGKGKIDKALLQKMVAGFLNKSLPTISPNGLYLYDIKY